MKERIEYLFKLLCDEYKGAALGKKASQKLFYFFEREGIKLNLRYGIHYYGPYSSKLSDMMDSLENDGIISIDDNDMTHIIRWIGTEEKLSCWPEDEKIARKVIDEFGNKSPLDLEGLSTMDFIANVTFDKKGNENELVDRFLTIKGEKFSKKEAKSYLQELKRLSLV